MKRMIRVASVVVAAGWPVCVSAQVSITPVVTAGDAAGLVGFVTSINSIAVNNSGQWIVEADTDNLDLTADVVRLKNGAVFLRENQTLAGISPGNLSSFGGCNINSAGNTGWNIFLRNTGASNNDSGLFYNGIKIIQESAISTATGLSANTPYIGFFDTRFNDFNQLMVIASVDDPAISSTVDRVIVIVDYNPGTGTFTESVVAKEGETLPGMSLPVVDFATAAYTNAFTNSGSVMFVALSGSSGGTNDAVYRNYTPLAIEGQASPVAGRNWSSLGVARCGMNNFGDYVHTGMISGDTATDAIIVKNGAKFMQEGDAPPGIGGGFALTAFGTSSIVQIADNGKVLWFGDWNDPNTASDTALFLDNQVLLRENVTQVNGLTVSAIVSADDGYMISPNGRYIIVEVTLTDGVTPRNSALLIDMGGGGGCYANCDASTGTPALTANDFQCFINKYAANDAYANCDASTGTPALTANDFQCFINKYAGGCR